jgi:hypothetical protein
MSSYAWASIFGLNMSFRIIESHYASVFRSMTSYIIWTSVCGVLILSAETASRAAFWATLNVFLQSPTTPQYIKHERNIYSHYITHSPVYATVYISWCAIVRNHLTYGNMSMSLTNDVIHNKDICMWSSSSCLRRWRL